MCAVLLTISFHLFEYGWDSNGENNWEATEEAPSPSHSCATLPNITISFLLIAHVVPQHSSSFPNTVMPLHNAYIRIDWLNTPQINKTMLYTNYSIFYSSLCHVYFGIVRKKQTNSHSRFPSKILIIWLMCLCTLAFGAFAFQSNRRKRNRFNLYVCWAQCNGVAYTAHHNLIVNTFGS